MNYLAVQWSHYNDHRGLKRVVLTALSVIEDGLRLLRVSWRLLQPIWFLRTRLTEGKTRRLLRPVVKYWRQNGIYEQNYFDCGERALVITLEWKDIRVMKGTPVE